MNNFNKLTSLLKSIAIFCWPYSTEGNNCCLLTNVSDLGNGTSGKRWWISLLHKGHTIQERWRVVVERLPPFSEKIKELYVMSLIIFMSIESLTDLSWHWNLESDDE